MTFSRRPGERMNRGRIAGTSALGPPPTPTGQLLAVSQAATASFAGSITSGLAAASLDLDRSKNITLGTTLRVTGTSPICTIAAGSGSLTYATSPPAIRITIEAGALTFKIGYDGELNVDTVSGITIPVGLTYTVPGGKLAAGNVISFPAGTYVAGDLEEVLCAQMVSADAGAYVFSQGTTANQPVFTKDSDGYCLRHLASHTVESTHATLMAMATNDPARTVLIKSKPDTASRAEDMLVWSQTGGTSGQVRYGKAVTGTGRLSMVGVTDGGTSTSISITRPVDDIAPNGTLLKFAWFGPGSNGGMASTVNDANSQSGTWNPGANATPGITPTRLTVGGTHDNAFRRTYAGKSYREVVFNSQLTGTQLTAWYAAL